VLPTTTFPLNVAIALFVFSVLGTLGGIWIAAALLRRMGMQRLTRLLVPPPHSAGTEEDDYFGLPGTGNVARGLLELICAQTDCSFAELFLPKQGDDCLGVVTLEGPVGAWKEAELAYLHPLVRRMAGGGEAVEVTEADDDLSLPAGTVLFPVLSRGHVIAAVAAGPRESGQAISQRSRRFVSEAVAQSSAALENAQLYRSLRRAFTEVEDAQRELLALQRVSVAAQSTFRLDQVLAQIAQGVADGLSYDLAIVYLADAENGVISMPVPSTANAPRATSGAPIALNGSNPTMRALLANEVLVTHDIEESLLPWLIDRGFLNPAEVPLNSTIANLPLASKGRVIGGMALTTQRPAFSDTEIDSLRSFAAQAAATIANARLYEELERAYRDVRTAQDQLIQAERLRTLGQVASGVAHDFNNILAAILSRTQIAQQQTRSAPLRDTLKVIEQAALDGAGAARRIQSLARPREELATETVDLSAVIQGALDLTRPMWSNDARARGVSLTAETSLAPNALVDGHASELREVLTNLILNATAAMPAGGKLCLRTERRTEEVWCSVEDTGTGMTDDVKQRVFDPFFTTKGATGSGLGMSIVAAILERHHGSIEIESEPGRGTAVRFSLPASAGEDHTPQIRKRRGRASLRILLAGEDEPAREALSLILSRHGHRVWATGTAEESMKLLVEQEFDIIVTDLGLGEHSGWEVAEAAKVIRPAAAVILATAWAAEWDADEIRRRGVEAILSKPYTVDEVLGCLEQALLKGG